jgi:signal transduction histidine kinase
VVRQGACDRVDVVLDRRADRIVALVRGDGADTPGRDSRLTSSVKSVPAIETIRERAAILGGKLIVETEPGRGITIFTTIPYADSNSAG